LPLALNEAGRVLKNCACVSANPFGLLNVTIRLDLTFVPTVVGENASVATGAAGLTATAVGQASLPAVAGAVVVALVAPTVMVATSVPPCESVTVRVSVPVPVTVACVLFAPEVMVVPPLAAHAYDCRVRLHAAALPLALKVTGLLAV
jgi:hypothetical protein